jgi:hypothetical protein
VCNHPFLFAEPGDAPAGGTDERIVSCSGKLAVLDRMLLALLFQMVLMSKSPLFTLHLLIGPHFLA